MLGARPQFIKASSVSRELLRRGNVQEVIVHTGQHFDRNMSEIFFEELEIPSPKYNLGINSLSNVAMVGETITALEPVMVGENPDIVLVYGDTNATLAGALTASYLNIPVAHVEAGLRAGNRAMAEEINRITTDRLSALNFAPNSEALANLVAEGLEENSQITGDVLYDSFLLSLGKLPTSSPPVEPYALMTLHRSENVDHTSRLSQILEFTQKFSETMRVVWVLHPRLLSRSDGLLDRLRDARIQLENPMGYLHLLSLLQSSSMVLTDSGGLQREAHFLGKQCVVLRAESEWNGLSTNGTSHFFGEFGLTEQIDTIFASGTAQRDLSIQSPGMATKNVVDCIEFHLSSKKNL